MKSDRLGAFDCLEGVSARKEVGVRRWRRDASTTRVPKSTNRRSMCDQANVEIDHGSADIDQGDAEFDAPGADFGR